jgi:hypothetical protein
VGGGLLKTIDGGLNWKLERTNQRTVLIHRLLN